MKELDQAKLKKFIVDGLQEDIQDGDHTSLACIPKNQKSRAKLLVKDHGILAGAAIARSIFLHLDETAEFEMIIPDGSAIKEGDIAFYMTCNSQALLQGERLALNTMQRLSGIASMSRTFYEEVKDYNVTILDTRKTTPLLRFLEKWAVAIGGCSNYRDGLYDRIMIKDNHIDACGSITSAVDKVVQYLNEKSKILEITVEVRNFKELSEVLALKTRVRVMLDNFSIADMSKAVAMIDGKVEVEASGGIKLNNVRSVASTGVNFISVGALTHSAQSLDLSLKIIK